MFQTVQSAMPTKFNP